MPIELKEDKINLLQRKVSRTVQFSKDEDINVSDLKPDIDKILKVKTRPIITEKELLDDKVIIKGEIKVNVLYMPLNDLKPVHNMESTIEMREEIYLEGVSDRDDIKVQCNLEDVVANELNTRKINVKAVGAISVNVSASEKNILTTDIVGEDNIEKYHTTIVCCQLKDSKTISYKIKEELKLPQGKPNILEILWYETTLENVETRGSNNKLEVNCNVKTCVFYLSEDANSGIQHYENDMDYSGEIKVDGIDNNTILDVELKLLNDTLTVRPDEDGEERNFLIDLETDIDFKSFKEEEIQYLEDAYTITDELVLTKDNINYQKFTCKNEGRYNLKDVIQLNQDDPSILQIYNVGADLYIDSMEIEEDGILVEGALTCNILYVPEENQAMNALKVPLPVEYKIDVTHLKDNSIVQLRSSINNMSCLVINDRELEIKSQILMSALVFEEKELSVIKGAEVQGIDSHNIVEHAGIVGYIAKENDRIWDIAKQFRIKSENLMSLNGIDNGNINKGDKLLIVKEICCET